MSEPYAIDIDPADWDDALGRMRVVNTDDDSIVLRTTLGSVINDWAGGFFDGNGSPDDDWPSRREAMARLLEAEAARIRTLSFRRP